jgi:hypothetical protein
MDRLLTGEERLHPMQWVRLLAFSILMALVIACGGGDSGGEDGDNGGSDGGGASNATAAATSDGGGGNSGGGGGGNTGGGGGGLEGDFDDVAERLEPPNSTESSRFATSDGLVVGWESSDSVDSLKEHYDDAIADADLNVIGTSSAAGTHSWFLGNEDGTGLGASVSIAPSGSGSGSTVGITVSENTGGGSGPAVTNEGGNAEGDVDEMVNRLQPPNGTETSRFSSSDGVVISWESGDSVDSVKEFYDSAIEDAGLNVYGTQSAAGTHSWVISEDSGNGYSGSVTIGPSSSGNGTSVSALLGFTP